MDSVKENMRQLDIELAYLRFSTKEKAEEFINKVKEKELEDGPLLLSDFLEMYDAENPVKTMSLFDLYGSCPVMRAYVTDMYIEEDYDGTWWLSANCPQLRDEQYLYDHLI